MKISTVLFDLDGTLLPLEQDEFIKRYFQLIVKYLAEKREDGEKYAVAMKKAVFAMMTNDGKVSNEVLFKKVFAAETGEDTPPEEIFGEFYEKHFVKLKEGCGFAPEAKEIVTLAKNAGFRVALATNPAFPLQATNERIRWAGLEPEDFELITAYENSSFCKPALPYYTEICEKLGVSPDECIMIGNDTLDDMEAEKLGMKTFLLTNCLVNRNDLSINDFRNGNWQELKEWLIEEAHP